MDKPTLISLFAGIGGLDLAAHWAGFETVRFVEKEPFCQKVLAKHWPNVPIDDNVFTSHPGYADVVCGGFPCQPFSVAGNRQGANDERYLLPEMLRIVREVKPYAILFENVPGFPQLSDGTEFKYLLGALAEMGFDAEWGHIRASDIGAPHPRERWFCVAYARSFGFSRTSTNDRRASPHNQERNNSTDWLKGERSPRGIGGSSNIYQSELGNPTSAGLERRNGSEPTFPQYTRPIEGNRTSATQERWFSKSRLGGTAYGLPGWLDFVGFPARPGEPQHAYEPPRTAPSTPTTNARIKSLGNAVVPQCAYPIFQAIYEWLEEIKQAEAA